VGSFFSFINLYWLKRQGGAIPTILGIESMITKKDMYREFHYSLKRDFPVIGIQEKLESNLHH
jgi:hypothetical protein